MLTYDKSQANAHHMFVASEFPATRDDNLPVNISAEAGCECYTRPGPTELTCDLSSKFPVVAKHVGKACFAGVAEGFVAWSARRPGRRFRLGAGFPVYLASRPDMANAAYLPDVARLEWAVFLSRSAPWISCLSMAELMLVRDDDFARLIFAVSPVTHTVTSRFPVDSIWRTRTSLSAGGSRETTSPDGDTVRLLVHPTADGDVQVRRLSKAEFAFFRVLRAGKTLGEAEKHATSIEAACDVGRMLLDLLDSRVLADFTIGSDLTAGRVS